MEYISHEDYKKMMSKFQEGTKKTILKEGLDPVGQEDSDPDNDGVKNTKSDKYILNRRKAIGKAIGRAKGGRMMREDGVEEYNYTDNYPGSWGYREGKLSELKTEDGYSTEGPDGPYQISFIKGVPYVDECTDLNVNVWVGDKIAFMKDGKLMKGVATNDRESGFFCDKLRLDVVGDPRPDRDYRMDEDDYTDPANAQSGDTDAMNIAEGGDEFDLTQKTPLDAQPQQPEVVQQISNTRFKIINPRGEEIEVDFDPYVDEWVDAYSGYGWLEGEDGEFMYWINADFENDGGVSPHVVGYENKVDYQELLRPNEGLHTPPLQATGPTISTVEEDMFKLPKRKDTAELDYDPKNAAMFKPDYMDSDDEDDDDDIEIDIDDEDEMYHKLPKNFLKKVSHDKQKYPFNENVVANPPIGYSVLAPGEREQLAEYIRSIKEIKKEINKLAGKAGKKVNFEEMGGDRTGLVMTSSTVSEEHSPEIEKIESKIPEKLYSITEKVLHELKKAGLTDGEIQMFIKHEIEEIGKEAIMSQHDL